VGKWSIDVSREHRYKNVEIKIKNVKNVKKRAKKKYVSKR